MAKTKSTAVEKQKKPKSQPKAKKVASAQAKTPTQKKNKTTENNPFEQAPDVDQRSIQSFCIKPGKETIPMSAQSSEPVNLPLEKSRLPASGTTTVGPQKPCFVGTATGAGLYEDSVDVDIYIYRF
jgi:hypothetical protein